MYLQLSLGFLTSDLFEQNTKYSQLFLWHVIGSCFNFLAGFDVFVRHAVSPGASR
jgi:hypothetical protein